MKRLTQIFQALLGVAALILTALIAAGRLAWRTVKSWWRKHSKRVKYSLAAFAILIVAGFVALTAYVLYEDKYGRDYYDRELSDNITLRSFSDNKWRVYNEETDEYTTNKFNWISDTSNDCSLAVYAVPHKRGYIDTHTGNIIIDAEANNYTKAWVFSDGIAAVEKEGKIGFVNEKNEVVIPFQYDYSDEHQMCNLGYLFHDGYCVMTNADGKLGLIDRSGNWVVEPEYDQLWAPQERGYRTVIKDDKYGLLDSSLNLVYPAVYDYIGNHSEKGGFILMGDGRMWQEDYEGNVVQPFMYESSEMLSYPANQEDDGYALSLSDYSKYQIAGKIGIMNRITGNPVTLAIYKYVEMISPNLFEVCPADNYGFYLVDTNGNVVKQEH